MRRQRMREEQRLEVIREKIRRYRQKMREEQIHELIILVIKTYRISMDPFNMVRL